MTELLSSLNWFAVLTSTVIYFALGALWYSPVLFAKTWMTLRDIKDEDIGEPNPIIFLYSFVLQFIAVISLALFIVALGIDTPINGAIIGLGAAMGILYTLSGTTGIFSDVPLKLHLLDNGYHMVGLTLSGIILGWW